MLRDPPPLQFDPYETERSSRKSVQIDDLAGLRSWNDVFEVVVFSVVRALLSFCDAPGFALFLVLLFLSSHALSLAFFHEAPLRVDSVTDRHAGVSRSRSLRLQAI